MGSDAARKIFDASRDFLLGWELLEQHHPLRLVLPPGRTVRWPARSSAVCASLALELALKSRLTLEGAESPRTHSYSDLFGRLSPEAREEVQAAAARHGVRSAADALRQLDAAGEFPPRKEGKRPEERGVFETWRYVHETTAARFDSGFLVPLTLAVHESVLRRRPEWRPVG